MHNYWEEAYKAALKSRDTNTKVGACFVKTVYSYTGCNYEIADIPGKLGFVHAEMAAITGSFGGVLYCTWGCCTNCAKLIVVSGITKLVTAKYDYPKWNEEIEWGHKILIDNGVAIEFREPVGKLLIGGVLR